MTELGIDGATAGGPVGQSALTTSLLESRERWRDIGRIAADFVWETDAAGRLTFLSPPHLLGWSATDLLGQPAACLLAPAENATAAGTVRDVLRDGAQDGAQDGTLLLNPFITAVPVRRRRVWLAGIDGQPVCFCLSSDPIVDASGACIGTRGVGVDSTGREYADNQTAAALRRGEVLEMLLGQLRHELQAPRMMDSILTALQQALGALGAAIVNVPANLAAEVSYAIGAPVGPVLATADQVLRRSQTALQSGQSDGGLRVLTCPVSTRFGEQAGVVVWRPALARDWDDDDRIMAASATGLIRIVLEHEAIQRQLATQARTDPLTGLLNRRAFMEEAARRIDRLDREELPGTLLYLDVDGFTALNNDRGQDAGDSVLIAAADLLQRTFRPADILGRIGADEFAVWLDGSDELTAAERAEALRLAFPRNLAELPSLAGPTLGVGVGVSDPIATLSIGIACRQPGTYEDLDSILARTAQVLRETKRVGRGQWRVSHARPTL